MKTTVTDLVSILSAITTIKNSDLIDSHDRCAILSELHHDLPLEVFSSCCVKTRNILKLTIDKELANASAKRTSPSFTAAQEEAPTESAKTELFLDADGHAGGPSKAQSMVNKTSKKRRKAGRNA